MSNRPCYTPRGVFDFNNQRTDEPNVSSALSPRYLFSSSTRAVAGFEYGLPDLATLKHGDAQQILLC
jgi:hypothetical protein